MMRILWKYTVVLAAMAAGGGIALAANASDLRDAAPPGAFLAVYTTHNSERDYQQQHYQEVWKTVQETRIFERLLQIIQSRAPETDVQQFLTVRDALRTALAPIQWDMLLNAGELLYAQKMVAPSSQHVLLIRIPDGGAASLHKAFENLFRLAEQAANGAINVGHESMEGFSIVSLGLPQQVPFSPVAGFREDVFIFASSAELAQESLKLLNNPQAESKFDDPRYIEAISHLPAMEDSVVFFDGRTMNAQMRGLGEFIRQISNRNPQAVRVADLLETIFTEFDAFDFEVTVEYTQGFQNRTASYGRFKEGAATTLVGKMSMHQQPFADWSRWVPAGANGFSLNAGVSVQPLYEWLMQEIPARFPEAQPALDRFAALQDQFDLHLDADILQAFSGEAASMAFPGKTPTPFGKSSESVMFLRCSKPERIQELLHRGFNALQEIPPVRAQGVGLIEVVGLDGFEEITGNFMGMVGIRPVIGFRDGWMILGSHASAVQRALSVRSEEVESFAGTDAFKQFAIEINGPVHAVSYTNTGESTRQIAQGLQQVGMMLPMILAMAGQQGGNGPDLTIVQDLAGLMPAIGKIVGKLDFIDKKLAVTQAGTEDGTWIRHSVTLIRPPVAALQPEAKTGIQPSIRTPEKVD